MSETTMSKVCDSMHSSASSAVGNDVAVQIEPHAEVLGQPVGAVEHTSVVAADNEDNRPARAGQCLQKISLCLQVRQTGLELGVLDGLAEDRPILPRDEDGRAIRYARGIVPDLA